MQLAVSRVEKPYLRATFPLIRFLNFLIILTFMAWSLHAEAQVSSFERANGEISGTVLLEADKRPAGQVAVSLKSRAAGIFRSVLTDIEGHFKVQNLPRGTYDIVVDEQGYEAAQTSTKLDGSSSKLVVYLRPKSRVLQRTEYSISLRELKIPRKAQKELQKGLELVGKNDPAASLGHFQKAT